MPEDGELDVEAAAGVGVKPGSGNPAASNHRTRPPISNAHDGEANFLEQISQRFMSSVATIVTTPPARDNEVSDQQKQEDAATTIQAYERARRARLNVAIAPVRQLSCL